jgi:predicted regulator of Ras-like GTPase activity (Roadblock/LC7/MglB family)
MLPTTIDQTSTILDELAFQLDTNLHCALIANRDGELVAIQHVASYTDEKFSSRAAVLAELAGELANQALIGEIDELLLTTEAGIIFILPVAERWLLALHLSNEANLGLARFEARQAAQGLAYTLPYLGNNPPAQKLLRAIARRMNLPTHIGMVVNAA